MPPQTDKRQNFGVTVGLFLVALYLFFSMLYLWRTFRSLPPQISAAIVAAVATLLVSVFSVLWSKRADRLREIEQEQRRGKIPVYEEFLSLIFRILFAEKLGDAPVSEREVMKTMSSFAQKLAVWGSDDVLRECSTWRRVATTTAQEDSSVGLFAIERILLAIRKDVGHKNLNFKEGDLLSIFINDLDVQLQKK